MKIRAALAIACTLVGACGPTWPSRATSVADPRVGHGSIHVVDVLPADLQLWAAEDAGIDPDQVQHDAEHVLVAATIQALTERNAGANVLGWDGSANGVPVLDPKALDATVGSLSGYGSIAEDVPHTLPVPYLPARLGEVTGADATLYVGGWSFVAKESDDTGKKILEGVLIAVAIVAVIGIIAVVSKGSGGGSHGGGGGGGGGGLAHAATHVVGQAGRLALRAGNIALEVAKTTARVGEEVLEQAGDPILDAFGHSVEAPARPDWSAGGPHDGDSQMYLEMTLVDNRTGLALWHAHQTFPARATHPDEVVRAARVVLATLPR